MFSRCETQFSLQDNDAIPIWATALEKNPGDLRTASRKLAPECLGVLPKPLSVEPGSCDQQNETLHARIVSLLQCEPPLECLDVP